MVKRAKSNDQNTNGIKFGQIMEELERFSLSKEGGIGKGIGCKGKEEGEGKNINVEESIMESSICESDLEHT